MGNYCCNNAEVHKFQEIEESKRERLKLSQFQFNEDQLSFRTFSVHSIGKPSKDWTLKQSLRRYLSLKFFSLTKKIKELGLPCKAIHGAYVTPIEIQMIEENLPPFHQSSEDEDLEFLPFVTLPSGDVYKGRWNLLTKQPEGAGLMIHSDHSKYLGCFKNGKKTGRGRLIKIDGEVYDGDFLNNYPEGSGVLTKSNGLVSKGFFKKGREHGEGIIEFEGEIIYSGGFMYGAKHGFGRLKISEGNSYEGEFLNGCMEGTGRYQWDDGKVYQGSWKANKIHGEGKYQWPDGRMYEGCYNDGNRDGFGIFKWPDGREYRGEWMQGNMHGIGTYTFFDKNGNSQTVKALWENGKKKKVLNM
jgi:hypothetical protein